LKHEEHEEHEENLKRYGDVPIMNIV